MKKIALIIAVVLCALHFKANAQVVRYVKTTASGLADGSSWANASADMQAMINASGAGDQVWVAAGTYKPTSGTNRNISFAMRNNVGIYGGFAGTETLLSQRNFHANATILSGDIGTPNDNSDNTYHIFYHNGGGINTTAVLDGFTIRDANGGSNLSSGGGIYNNNVSPTISNCTFLYNTSGSGAGIFDGSGSNAIITNCVFAFNTGTFNGSCGAAFADAQSSSTLTNCLFVSNNATTGSGGAITAYLSNLTATNCTFYGNHANIWGGGLFLSAGCNVTLKNSIVWGNTAGSFPQYANNNGSTLAITYSDIQGGYSGAGNINADPQFANTADADGADNIFGTTDDGLFINCTSPALNTGNNTGVTATDLTGNTRIQFTTVDMGAYELATLTGVTWYFDNDGDNYYGSTTTSCTSPGAGWSLTTLGADCNDNNIFVHTPITWYQDGDGDNYYGATQVSCFQPGAGWYDISLSGGGDCDDNNNTVWQSGTLYIDADNDGYDGGTATVCYGNSTPQGYSTTTLGSDCNDNNASAHESFPFYTDADGDGVGAGSLVSVCAVDAGTPPTGYSLSGTDCDDGDNTAWQSTNLFIDVDADGYSTGVAMVCYGATIPNGYATGTAGPDCDDFNPFVWHTGTFYLDEDGDGYDNGSEMVCYGSTIPGDYSATTLGFDCDDLNPAVYQTLNGYVDADGDGYTVGGLVAVCSGATLPVGYSTTSLGTDCSDNDNTVWEMTNFYIDADLDGYDGGIAYNICFDGITPPTGYLYTTLGSDCNDNNPTLWESSAIYIDNDGDGYTNGTAIVCHGATAPAGYRFTSLGSDCDDNNPNIHPGAIEIPGNGVDENCNGMADDCTPVVFTISGNVSICSGSSTTLNAGSYASFNWSTGATTQTISVNASGTFSVIVNNANGCTGSASVTTMVNANPTPSISGSLSFCAGSSTILNAGLFSTYNWSTGATTQSISVNTAGTFTVTVTNAFGCTGSTNVTTTINASPTPMITGGNISCAVNTSTLNAGVYSAYSWSTGATTQSISVNSAGTFTVTVTNGIGCSGSNSTTVIASGVIPGKPTWMTGTLTDNCRKQNVTYLCSTVAGAASYLWTVPTGVKIISGQGTTSIVVNYTPAFINKGVITVAAVNACGMSAALKRNTSSRLNSPLISGVNYMCPNDIKTYTVAPIVGALSYTWTKVAGSTILSGQGTSIVTIKWGSIGGVIKCTANNACGASVAAQYAVSLVCAKVAGSAFDFSEINLYPNPATTSATVQFSAFAEGKGLLTVYDLVGQQVLSKPLTVLSGDNQFVLDLNAFPKGIYNVRVDYNGMVRNQKLVVQ